MNMPVQPVRSPKWPLVLRNVSILIAVALVFWLIGSRMGGSPQESETGGDQSELEAARRALQLGRAQAALDALEDKKTAEALYLRALAFEQQQIFESARTSIAVALEKEPDAAKYRGLQLRLRLYDGDKQAAESLIALHRKHPSSAPVALFAFFARSALAARATAERDFDRSQAELARADDALRNAAAQAKQCPELHPELLAFAMQRGLQESAWKVVQLQEAAAPDDLATQNRKVQVLMQRKRYKEALEIAARLYRQGEESLEAARAYAQALGKSGATKEADEAFAALRKKYPKEDSILVQHAIYLSRTGRLDQAMEMLNKAVISRPLGTSSRDKLVLAAVTLPLEVGDARIAEEQLNQHRAGIHIPALLALYEGRLLFLQKNYKDAMQKMASVVRATTTQEGAPQSLQREAMRWLGRIKAAYDAERKAKETVEGSGT